MTCPGCEREEVTLIGGYCGHCSSTIAGAVDDALDELDVLDGTVVDVSAWKDGYLHIRVDVDGGADA